MKKIINELRYTLYFIKQWFLLLFIYPYYKMMPKNHFDYDSYGREKRGVYMGRLGRWQLKRANLTIEIIKKSGVGTVNDVGSGAGEVLRFIKTQTKLKSATFFDSSPYVLEVAKSIGLDTVLFDINNEDDFKLLKPTDLTLMFEVLEHIPNSEILLKKAFDISRKGVLFSFPNTGFFIYRFRLFFFGKFPLQWGKHPKEHLRFWTKKDLKWWLKAQGYKNYQIYPYTGIPLLKNIWPNMFSAGLLVELNK